MARFAKLPYFMTNKDWYYYDEKEGRLVMKDDAPEEAKKSYEKIYAELEEMYLRNDDSDSV